MTTKLSEGEPAVEVAWTPPTPHRESGPAVAAIISAVLGLITLAVVNLGTQVSKAFNAWVHGIATTLLWPPVFEYLAGH